MAPAAQSTWSRTRRRRRRTRKSIIPAFQETEEGADVDVSASFGSSGDQSRAVEAGQPADFVHLPLQPDITRIVESGQVAEDYAETEENGGVVQTSVVSFGVRPGNPKDIQDWDDLIRDDVEVDHPEPVHLGWRALEHHGRVRPGHGGAEDEQAGARLRRRRCSPTPPCRTGRRVTR